MLQKIKITTFLFILCLFPNIGNATSHEPFVGEASGCSVEVEKKDKDVFTNFTCGKIKFKLEQEFIDNKFLRWGQVEGKKDSYIFLIFSKGAHGEKVVIFSLAEGIQLETITSSWPIDFVKLIEGAKLTFSKDSDKDGHYPKFHYLFK